MATQFQPSSLASAARLLVSHPHPHPQPPQQQQPMIRKTIKMMRQGLLHQDRRNSTCVRLGRQCHSGISATNPRCGVMPWLCSNNSSSSSSSILSTFQSTKGSLSYYSTLSKSLQSETTTTTTTTTKNTAAASSSKIDENDDNDNDNDDDAVQVYESPFGGLVTRLRSISLLTAVAGSVGLPIVIALKGTGMPTGGFLALCLSFGTGTLASTAAIHYVFGPYVFYIDKIPVRKCHSIPKVENDGSTSVTPPHTTKTATTSNTPSYLYKATTKSIFLTRIETVFDPATDVTAYKGFTKPLCNLVVRDQTYLFVHKESVYDNELYTKLPLKSDSDHDDDDNNDGENNTSSGTKKKSSFQRKVVTEEKRREKEADKDDERFLF